MRYLDLRRTVGRWRVPALIVLAVAVDTALVGLYATERLLGAPLGFHVTELVDLSGEESIPTWYASMKLFVLGVVMFVLASVYVNRRVPRAWIMMLLAVAVLGMSLDEVATVHERIGLISDRLLPGGDRANTAFRSTGVWMFFLAAPAFLGLLWMVLASRGLWRSARATRLFVLGLAVLLGSAGGLEILSNFATGRMLAIQIMAEEFGEMVGVTLMLWGAYELAAASGIAFFVPAEPGSTMPALARDGGK